MPPAGGCAHGARSRELSASRAPESRDHGAEPIEKHDDGLDLRLGSEAQHDDGLEGGCRLARLSAGATQTAGAVGSFACRPFRELQIRAEQRSPELIGKLGVSAR